jgi:hypothetical protein
VVVVALAAASVALVPAAFATSSVNGVWTLGTVDLAPGGSKSWTWNNANSDIYLAGSVADSGTNCAIGNTVRYRRTSTGARKVLVTITNHPPSDSTCRVTAYLVGLKADRTSVRGVLDPGESSGVVWNNAQLGGYVYVAGAIAGTPSSGTCQLEVTSRARTHSDGEDEFLPRVRNTGSVACEASLTYGWLNIEDRGEAGTPGGAANAGWSSTIVMGGTSPFRAFAAGLDTRPASSGDCIWEISDVRNYNFGNGDQASFRYSNVGLQRCPIPQLTAVYFE